MSLYGPRYLHHPTSSNIKKLYAHHANVDGLPGMSGSLDCMHSRWNLCPNAYHVQHTKGNYHYHMVVLEVVASHNLWLWNSFFGSVGPLNEINILKNSPIF